jgi:hypothetical protein
MDPHFVSAPIGPETGRCCVRATHQSAFLSLNSSLICLSGAIEVLSLEAEQGPLFDEFLTTTAGHMAETWAAQRGQDADLL